MLKRIITPLALGCSVAFGVQAGDCKDFLNFAGDADKVKAQFKKNPEQTAWQWFTCLNKPVDSNIREWETFKPTSQVYLANGHKPKPYTERDAIPQQVIDLAKTQGMDTDKLFHYLDTDLQVDGLTLDMGGQSPETKYDTYVRYQLLMDEGTFNYIVDKKIYNVNGQEALTGNLNFPEESWELKTSWLWIGNNSAFLRQLTNDKYYIANGYYIDDQGAYQVGYIALSGMHIINKLVTDWVWMTFENNNNAKYTVTKQSPAQPMVNHTGPTPAAKVQNTLFQDKEPALSEYELIGVQWSFDQEPKLLASSQMESAFQLSSSCIACHYTAAYSDAKGYYNFARKVDGGILYPTEKTQDTEFTGYKMLDFVWSLKRAKWER